MKILYDHQAFSMQRRGGVSRYFAEILQKMHVETGAEVVLSLAYSNNEYIHETNKSDKKNIQASQSRVFIESAKFPFKEELRKNKYAMNGYIFLSKQLNKVKSKRYLKEQDFDVFHATYYDPYFLEYLKYKPFVLTIHDMIHEIFPEYFSKNDNTSERKRLLASKAKKIIAISQNTKDDIVKLLKIDPEKIIVVHHANFLTEIDEEFVVVPTRYILYVGGRRRYKNFAFFVESVAGLLQRDGNIHIVCVGGGDFDEEEGALFRKLLVDEKVLHLVANDKQLIYLYRNALCLALPSLYEGFGIPILEAFAYRCPVLLSDASCFPEIAGNAGCYFDPKDKDSILLATKRILGDEEYRNILVESGTERLKNFSSEKMIRETYAVYKKCLVS